MVLEVKIDHLRAEKMKVKHQSVFFGTPCRMVIVEGCCTLARSSSFRSKLFIG